MSFFDPIIPLIPQLTSNIAPQILPTIYSGSNHSIKPNISYQNQIYQSNNEYDHQVNSNFQKQNNNVNSNTSSNNSIPNTPANVVTKSNNLPTPKQEQYQPSIPYGIPDNSKVINQVLQFSFNNGTNNAHMPYYSPLAECSINNITQSSHLPINNANLNTHIPYYSPLPSYSSKQKKLNINQNLGELTPTSTPSQTPTFSNNSPIPLSSNNMNTTNTNTISQNQQSHSNHSYYTNHYYSPFESTKNSNQVLNHSLNSQNTVVLPPVPPTSTLINFSNGINNNNSNSSNNLFSNNHDQNSTTSLSSSSNNNQNGVLDSIDSILQRQTQYTCFPYRNNFEYLSPSIFDTSMTSNNNKKVNNSVFNGNKNPSNITTSPFVKSNIILNNNVDEVIADIVKGKTSKTFPVAIGSEIKNQKKLTKQLNKSTNNYIKSNDEIDSKNINNLNSLVVKSDEAKATSNDLESKAKLVNSISLTLSKSIINVSKISNTLNQKIISENINVNTKQQRQDDDITEINSLKIDDILCNKDQQQQQNEKYCQSNNEKNIQSLSLNQKSEKLNNEKTISNLTSQEFENTKNILETMEAKETEEIMLLEDANESIDTSKLNETSKMISKITNADTTSVLTKTKAKSKSKSKAKSMSSPTTNASTITTLYSKFKNEARSDNVISGVNKKKNNSNNKNIGCDYNNGKNGKLINKKFQQNANEKSQYENTKGLVNNEKLKSIREHSTIQKKGINLNDTFKSSSLKAKDKNISIQGSNKQNSNNKSITNEVYRGKSNISFKSSASTENRSSKANSNSFFKSETHNHNHSNNYSLYSNNNMNNNNNNSNNNSNTNTNVNNNSISHVHCNMRKALTERNDRVAWQSYKEMAENKNLKDLSHTDFSRILRILRNERGPVRSPNNLNEMVQIIENIKEAGFQPNHGDFTTMIAAFGRSHQLVKALTYFEEMKQAKLEPDIFTYNTLIDVYGKNKELHSAVKIFNEMKEKKLKPTLATYNILISAHGLNEDPKGAKLWFDCVINDPSLSANEITYSNIMDAYARVGDVQSTLKYLNEMKSHKINPSLGHYNSLVLVYTKVGDIEKATEKLNEMKEKGMEPSPHIYSLLMNAYGENNNISEAFKILYNHHKKPGRSMYHTMIQLYGKKGDLLNAWQTLGQMIQQRITPTPLTWRILASCHGDNPCIMFWAQQVNIIPTAAMYNHFLEYYSKQPNIKAVNQLFDEMMSQHFTPTIETYNSILHAHSILGDSASVFRVYSELEKAKLEPNLYTYNILLKIYAKIGDNQSAMELFEKEIIPREPYGVIPDAFTYNALLESFNEKFDQSALKYLDDMKAKGLAPVPHRDIAIMKAIHALKQ